MVEELTPEFEKLVIRAGKHPDAQHFEIYFKGRKLKGVTAIELLTREGEYY